VQHNEQDIVLFPFYLIKSFIFLSLLICYSLVSRLLYTVQWDNCLYRWRQQIWYCK